MAAGLADKPWTTADIAQLIKAREATAVTVGQCRQDRRNSK